MPSIRTHAVLDHSADTVWLVIRDYAGIAAWFPAMTASEGADLTRVVTLGDGSRLEEDIVTLDDGLRRLQYRVTGGDLEIDSHLATVDVIPLGDDSCVLVYGTDIEPASAAEAFDVAISEAVTALGSYLA